MSNSDSYISNMANNYRYSNFRVVAACTELVLRYIILFVVENVPQLHYCPVTNVPTSCHIMIHSISAEIWELLGYKKQRYINEYMYHLT